MTHEEIRQYFETGEPDADDTISILAVRRILYDYAQTFDIELRIEEHLPGNQRIHFDTFTEYFLRNTTDAALMAYHPSGHLRWRSNLRKQPSKGVTSLRTNRDASTFCRRKGGFNGYGHRYPRRITY